MSKKTKGRKPMTATVKGTTINLPERAAWYAGTAIEFAKLVDRIETFNHVDNVGTYRDELEKTTEALDRMARELWGMAGGEVAMGGDVKPAKKGGR